MSTPGEFHEDWLNPAHDPLGHGAQDFPYEEVFARLDGDLQPEEDEAALALRQLLTWVVDIAMRNKGDVRYVGARALVMIWTINPNIMGGCSLNAVARHFGLSRDMLHRISSEFSRTFKVRNPAQRHAWNWTRTPKAP